VECPRRSETILALTSWWSVIAVHPGEVRRRPDTPVLTREDQIVVLAGVPLLELAGVLLRLVGLEAAEPVKPDDRGTNIGRRGVFVFGRFIVMPASVCPRVGCSQALPAGGL
jgi:hypothetical protein